MFSIVSKRCCRDASTCLPFLWKTQQQPLLLSKLDTSSRYVHSNTQIKRLFKQNATRARIEERMGIDRTPLTLDPPKYPQVYSSFTLLPNGWSAPPGPDFTLPNYPFSITRTKDKPNDSIGFLPVYSKFRKDGTKCTTRIRKVEGNCDAFIKEIRSVLNIPLPTTNEGDRIRVRIGGTVEIKGNRVREVKEWLAGLGF